MGEQINEQIYHYPAYFFGVACFFDRNSLVGKMQLRGKIATLKKEKAYYQNKIEEDNRKMKELLSNKDNLEKFAREQYLIKNKNEDIFVIVNK